MESTPASFKETGDFRRFLGNAHGARAEALMRVERYAEALPDWEQALALEEGDRRRIRMQRALALAYLKEHARATAEADALAGTHDLAAILLYDAARVHAMAAAAVHDQAQLSEKYVARAVDLLRRAVERGYKDLAQIKKDSDLDALRSREEFKKLLNELEERQAESESEKQKPGDLP